MNIPRATYRLQFREGMTFDRAVELVPYLKELGISHLYASPIFTATAGSTHGYDVTDQNEIDPALGGRAGFDRLSGALKQAGLGLLLDIVPNHMAASTENPWWRSVLEWGAQSPFRAHFDIDWRERLTLPILGKPYADALGDGDFGLAADAGRGELVFTYFDTRLPLAPASYAVLLEGVEGEAARAIVTIAEAATPDAPDAMHAAIRTALSDPSAAELQASLTGLSADKDRLDRLHALQSWELHLWTDALQHLSYRRFFEVTGLVGVPVEREAVFEDVHRLTLELVRSGQVDGLRVDHVDGLADPKAYLERLRQAAGPETYIVVEKILAEGELFPADWPVSGTTGYEFIAAIADLAVDAGKAAALDDAYHAAIGREPELEAETRAAKTLILRRNFEGELERLVALAAVLDTSSVHSHVALKDAIAELIVSFPVYRTYGSRRGLPHPDRRLLGRIVADAAEASGPEAAPVLDFVAGLLTGHAEGLGAADIWPFRRRFQQLSGPVMAKAIEDTLFYRYNRLIALNEVGGEPDQAGRSVERFHARMAEHRTTQPYGLLATSTHDTKRGEDARARLYAISEAPEEWGAAVERWRGFNAGHVRPRKSGASPGPETEWLICQALAGVWPDDLDIADAAGLEALRDRFLPYIEKAAREAKRRTDWIEPDERHEDAVKAYAAALLDPQNRRFLEDFSAVLKPFIQAGEINSLAQTLVKLTAPGVPDIYQGAELWDLSLVDPDNRRPLDLARLAAGLREAGLREGRGLTKQRLIQSCLDIRRDDPALFREGGYEPLHASGPADAHVVGFIRRHGSSFAITLVPRLPLTLLDRNSGRIDPARWRETAIDLPDGVAGRALRNCLDGQRFAAAPRIDLSAVFVNQPAALLVPADDR